MSETPAERLLVWVVFGCGWRRFLCLVCSFHFQGDLNSEPIATTDRKGAAEPHLLSSKHMKIACNMQFLSPASISEILGGKGSSTRLLEAKCFLNRHRSGCEGVT